MQRIVVAGGGVFGLTAALSLRRRGWQVELFDPGPIPHPLAASTDASKAVRADYGADEGYTALAEHALAGWRAWNAAWGEPLFHETGCAFLSRAPLAAGGFEADSFALLTRRGHAPERLDAGEIARRFPAFRPGAFVDGYYNPTGGWAESARVVERLAAEARAEGVAVRAGAPVREIALEGDRAVGLRIGAGEVARADVVLIAAGSWTPALVPALAPHLHAVGQPIFHLAPADPAPYQRLPMFGADIARTGWYGFPAMTGGTVKVANHGVGRRVDPADQDRTVPEPMERALCAFLADALPGLAGAPIVHRRLCAYSDSRDGDFWIAPDPTHPGLVVAAGGSGHAFKFAPVLGGLVADAVEGRASRWSPRFRWREAKRAREEARFAGG